MKNIISSEGKIKAFDSIDLYFKKDIREWIDKRI